MALAAQQHLATLIDGILDKLFHGLHGADVNQGALLGVFIHAVAHFHFADGRHQFFSKGVVDPLLYQQSVGADTSLSGVAELGFYRTLHRGIQIRILKYDKWRITAQFHGRFFNGTGALLDKFLADFGGSCESQLAHNRIAGQLTADGTGRTGDHTQGSRRQSCAFAQLGHGQC